SLDANAGGFDLLDLLDQGLRIDDNTAADDAMRLRVKDAGRQQVQNVTVLADLDGVAGVVATLVTRHHIEAFRQDVDNLALAFVTPLETNDGEISFHSKV